MRIGPTKAFPHPVLREGSSDYSGVEFEMEPREPVRAANSTELLLAVDFVLSDDDLLERVGRGDAEFVVLVRCPHTRFRDAFRSAESHVEKRFAAGALFGVVEVTGFLSSTSDAPLARSENMHSDYGEIDEFSMNPGTVLAVDGPYPVAVDHVDDQPLSSIFSFDTGDDLADGEWRCLLDGEKVTIQVNQATRSALEEARSFVRGNAEGTYLLNGLYLAALIYVMTQADADASTYEDRRWFTRLNYRLAQEGRAQLREAQSDRIRDAQAIFKMPLASLLDLRDKWREGQTA